MNMILCDVVTPIYVYPLLYLLFAFAGLIIVAIAVLLYRFLKKRKKENSENTEKK